MPRAKDLERAEKEARMQDAIAEYKRRQNENPKDPKSSVRLVATDFYVPRKTLEGRLKGAVPCNQAHEADMNLMIHEEKELANWITTLTQRGYAPRYRTVRELAEATHKSIGCPPERHPPCPQIDWHSEEGQPINLRHEVGFEHLFCQHF